MQNKQVLEQELEALLAELYDEMMRRGGGLKAYLRAEDIEDAVQDACLQLLVMIREGRVHTSLPSLVHLVVRRRGCHQFAWQQRQQRLKDVYEKMVVYTHEGPIDPSKAAEKDEEDGKLWQAIEELDELDRLAIGLRYFGGYSYREIAAALGFKGDREVNTCLRRARRQLRDILKGGAA